MNKFGKPTIETEMMRIRIISPAAVLLLLSFTACLAKGVAGANDEGDGRYHTSSSSNNKNKASSSYGLDVSFPTHSTRTSIDDNDNPLGPRQEVYLDHLAACRRAYPNDNSCDQSEDYRILMNQRQPMSMQNYTAVGFKKIRAPDNVVALIDNFWKQNHFKGRQENWPAGNSFVNHWESPTYLVSVDDKQLRGSGKDLKEAIWGASAATLEMWTKQELQPCSLYGIRVYRNGAIMLPHVDRLPLVASAMINVAQDVDEPWPFELYDHAGRAHNVTLDPGDMLLFESHSVIHGHPFPLKGRYYAMIFLHFEPTGESLEYDSKTSGFHRIVDKQYKSSINRVVGGQSSDVGGTAALPPYIKRESPEEENWRKLHPLGWRPPYETLPSTAHVAALEGDLKALKEELDKDQKVLTERDDNGWQTLHKGVASGNEEVVQLLVSRGAEINARTHGGYGESPLRVAENRFGPTHSIVKYLKGLGALSLGPEL